MVLNQVGESTAVLELIVQWGKRQKHSGIRVSILMTIKLGNMIGSASGRWSGFRLCGQQASPGKGH